MTDADTDLQLMMAVKEGDREALAELYERHSPQMLGVAYRLLENRRDAEDLLHDVFLEAWQHAQDYRAERGSVRHWLSIRVRSRAIDRLRTLRRARDCGMLPNEAEVAVDEPSRITEHTRACRLLVSLPPAQRTAIELGYFQGLTCREIAEHCQIPVGTVKSRLSAAVAKLREGLTRPMEEG